MIEFSAIIIGDGLVSCLTADALAEQGFSVLILGQEKAIEPAFTHNFSTFQSGLFQAQRLSINEINKLCIGDDDFDPKKYQYLLNIKGSREKLNHLLHINFRNSNKYINEKNGIVKFNRKNERMSLSEEKHLKLLDILGYPDFNENVNKNNIKSLLWSDYKIESSDSFYYVPDTTMEIDEIVFDLWNTFVYRNYSSPGLLYYINFNDYDIYNENGAYKIKFSEDIIQTNCLILCAGRNNINLLDKLGHNLNDLQSSAYFVNKYKQDLEINTPLFCDFSNINAGYPSAISFHKNAILSMSSPISTLSKDELRYGEYNGFSNLINKKSDEVDTYMKDLNSKIQITNASTNDCLRKYPLPDLIDQKICVNTYRNIPYSEFIQSTADGIYVANSGLSTASFGTSERLVQIIKDEGLIKLNSINLNSITPNLKELIERSINKLIHFKNIITNN